MNWPPCGASCAHSWICKSAIHADRLPGRHTARQGGHQTRPTETGDIHVERVGQPRITTTHWSGRTRRPGAAYTTSTSNQDFGESARLRAILAPPGSSTQTSLPRASLVTIITSTITAGTAWIATTAVHTRPRVTLVIRGRDSTWGNRPSRHGRAYGNKAAHRRFAPRSVAGLEADSGQ